MNPACYCGHQEDEHEENGGPCDVVGCECKAFDPDDKEVPEDPDA